MTTIRNFAELALAVTFFFLLVNNLRTEADIDLVARLIMGAGAAAAAIAVIFYVIPQAWTVRVLDGLARFNYPGGYGALRFIEDNVDNPMRAIGTMVDPERPRRFSRPGSAADRAAIRERTAALPTPLGSHLSGSGCFGALPHLQPQFAAGAAGGHRS